MGLLAFSVKRVGELEANECERLPVTSEPLHKQPLRIHWGKRSKPEPHTLDVSEEIRGLSALIWALAGWCQHIPSAEADGLMAQTMRAERTGAQRFDGLWVRGAGGASTQRQRDKRQIVCDNIATDPRYRDQRTEQQEE